MAPFKVPDSYPAASRTANSSLVVLICGTNWGTNLTELQQVLEAVGVLHGNIRSVGKISARDTVNVYITDNPLATKVAADCRSYIADNRNIPSSKGSDVLARIRQGEPVFDVNAVHSIQPGLNFFGGAYAGAAAANNTISSPQVKERVSAPVAGPSRLRNSTTPASAVNNPPPSHNNATRPRPTTSAATTSSSRHHAAQGAPIILDVDFSDEEDTAEEGSPSALRAQDKGKGKEVVEVVSAEEVQGLASYIKRIMPNLKTAMGDSSFVQKQFPSISQLFVSIASARISSFPDTAQQDQATSLLAAVPDTIRPLLAELLKAIHDLRRLYHTSDRNLERAVARAVEVRADNRPADAEHQQAYAALATTFLTHLFPADGYSEKDWSKGDDLRKWKNSTKLLGIVSRGATAFNGLLQAADKRAEESDPQSSKLQQQVASQKSLIDAKQREVDALRSQNSSTELELAESQRRGDNAVKDLEALQQQAHGYEDMITDVASQLTDLISAASPDTQDADVDHLLSVISSLTPSIEAALTAVVTAMREGNLARQQSQAAYAELATFLLESLYPNNPSSVGIVPFNLDMLDPSNSSALLTSLSQGLSALEHERSTLRAERERLSSQLANEQQQRKRELDDEQERHSSELASEAERSHEEMELVKKGHQKEMDELRAQLETTRMDLAHAQQEGRSQSDTLELKSREVERLELEVTSSQARADSAESQLCQLLVVANSLSSSLDAASSSSTLIGLGLTLPIANNSLGISTVSDSLPSLPYGVDPGELACDLLTSCTEKVTALAAELSTRTQEAVQLADAFDRQREEKRAEEEEVAEMDGQKFHCARGALLDLEDQNSLKASRIDSLTNKVANIETGLDLQSQKLQHARTFVVGIVSDVQDALLKSPQPLKLAPFSPPMTPPMSPARLHPAPNELRSTFSALDDLTDSLATLRLVPSACGALVTIMSELSVAKEEQELALTSERDDLIDKLSVATVILDAVLPFVGASSSDLLAMTVDQARQSADSIASKFNGHEQKINDLHTTLARSQEQLSTFSSFIESLRSCAHFPRPLLSTLDAFLAGATTPAQLAESFRPASLLGIVHLEMRSRHIASKLRHAECTIAELQNAGNENVAALIATRKEMEPLEEEAAVVRDELVPLINSLLKLLHPAQAQAQALDTGASPLVPALCATLRKVNTFVKHSFTPSVLSLPEEYDLRNREKQQGNDEIARLLTQKRQLKKQLVQLEALLKQQGDSSSKLIKRSKLKARLADKDAQLADKEVELALVKQQLADEQKQREHCDQRIASVKRALDIGAESSAPKKRV